MMLDRSDCISIFLCGDVMTGRGIDQILPQPGNPVLHEPHVHDAREYVRMAEDASGPIPRPVGWTYVWGDALAGLQEAAVDVRIINLETSITTSEAYWHDKDVHYRMSPGNIACIQAAGICCSCLANNHVLDWGYKGLTETLQTLDEAGIAHAGAGPSAAGAASPAILEAAGKGRVLVFSLGSISSGIPWQWRAGDNWPGVNLLEDLSEDTAVKVASQVRPVKQPGDVAVASIHWGANWGYDLPADQIRFAHRLIDEGVDIVHGHSSHHVKAVEVYKDRLILYGCGDMLNDYEGIGGQKRYRGDLTFMYMVTMDPWQGRLASVWLVPMQIRRFRLNRALAADAAWLQVRLNSQGPALGTTVQIEIDGTLSLRWR